MSEVVGEFNRRGEIWLILPGVRIKLIAGPGTNQTILASIPDRDLFAAPHPERPQTIIVSFGPQVTPEQLETAGLGAYVASGGMVLVGSATTEAALSDDICEVTVPAGSSVIRWFGELVTRPLDLRIEPSTHPPC